MGCFRAHFSNGYGYASARVGLEADLLLRSGNPVNQACTCAGTCVAPGPELTFVIVATKVGFMLVAAASENTAFRPNLYAPNSAVRTGAAARNASISCGPVNPTG